MNVRRSKRLRLNQNDESDNEPLEENASQPPRRRLPRRSCNTLAIPSTSRQQNIDTSEQNMSEEEDESNLSLENCRLRHGLNEYCLYEIFKFLDVYDLIQLCELDIYFQNVIVNWVIGKKLINFTKMEPCWSTNKFFQVFGKTMRKIKIADRNTLVCFERFLNFVIQYCSVDRLTDLELRDFGRLTVSTAIIRRSMPFFSNLRNLILYESNTRAVHDVFLTHISTSATYLTHLTLHGINISGRWLLANGMENLRELRLHTSDGRTLEIDTTDLATFLRTKPKLELFSYVGNSDIRTLVDTLASYCTQLRAFIHVHLGQNRITDPYNCLRQFNGVTTVGLTSYTQCASDLYYPLVRIAARNQVETLKIYIDREIATILPDSNRRQYTHADFAHFNRLKSIELQIKDEKSKECELNTEFLIEIISKLENIEEVIVKCQPSLLNIHKVIDIAPNLKELGISQVKMKYLPVEMLRIVKSIRKNREQKISMGQLNPAPFRLTVNKPQWRELQVYKDVDIILHSTIDHKDYDRVFQLTGV